MISGSSLTHWPSERFSHLRSTLPSTTPLYRRSPQGGPARPRPPQTRSSKGASSNSLPSTSQEHNPACRGCVGGHRPAAAAAAAGAGHHSKPCRRHTCDTRCCWAARRGRCRDPWRWVGTPQQQQEGRRSCAAHARWWDWRCQPAAASSGAGAGGCEDGGGDAAPGWREGHCGGAAAGQAAAGARAGGGWPVVAVESSHQRLSGCFWLGAAGSCGLQAFGCWACSVIALHLCLSTGRAWGNVGSDQIK